MPLIGSLSADTLTGDANDNIFLGLGADLVDGGGGAQHEAAVGIDGHMLLAPTRARVGDVEEKRGMQLKRMHLATIAREARRWRTSQRCTGEQDKRFHGARGYTRVEWGRQSTARRVPVHDVTGAPPLHDTGALA